jgi:hypothetical protein
MRFVKQILATTLMFSLAVLLVQGQEYRSTLNRGYYTFGINAGKAYQSSDVRAQSKGYGFGLTLGRNLYYRPGAVFSADVRSRLLFARSYGLDPSRDYKVGSNDALNGSRSLDYRTYPANLGVTEGFVFPNHRTDLGELGLEGVLTLNKLREETGLKLSIYGGAGIDWFNVAIDQADRNGQEYYDAYAKLNHRGPTTQILKSLRSDILDGSYESRADEFDSGAGKLRFMPSLGAEVGFQVTPKFSIDFGHRLTFSGTDLLDGQQWRESNNDLHHYTYAGLNFNINRQERRDEPPRIRFIEPDRSGTVTYDPTATIVARVENVRSAADINLLVNGRTERFSFRNQKLEARVPLRYGDNEVRITASNPAGSDQAQVTIYQQDRYNAPDYPQPPRDRYPPTQPPPPPPGPALYPPTIDITYPSQRNHRTQDAEIRLEARVQYVQSRRDLEVLVNGRAQDFDYDERRDQLTANVRLLEGENRIVIRAINPAGRDEDECTVYREQRYRRPEVRITAPADRTETQQPVISLTATVQEVFDRRELRLEVNQRPVSQFDFSNGRLSATIQLIEGANQIAVIAQTASGTAQDQVTVLYKKSGPLVQPPRVDILDPADRTVVKNPKITLTGRVLHIGRAQDIQLTVNGLNITDFSFTGETVTARFDLREGQNAIRLSANNAAGSDEESIQVTYERPVVQPSKPPVVMIVEPADNSTVKEAQVPFVGRVRNVSQVSQVRLSVNGLDINYFQLKNEEVRAGLTLADGRNTLTLRATNQDGSDEQTVVVFYIKPIVIQKNPPVITIHSPADGSSFEQAGINLSASVTNISQANQVRLYLNGRAQSKYSFSNGDVRASLTLEQGQNTIRLSANNADGSDEKNITVFFRKEIPPPQVSILEPANGSTFSKPMVKVRASVKNVPNKQDIELTVNGKGRPYEYDTKNEVLTASVLLVTGRNTIAVTVNSSTGNARDAVEITARGEEPVKTDPGYPGKVEDDSPTVPKPVVTIESISQPTVNPMNPKVGRSTITAKVQHVSSRSGVKLNINSQDYTDFTFDEATGALQSAFTLQQGDNKITLQATNPAGTTEESRTVQFGSTAPGGGNQNPKPQDPGKDQIKTPKRDKTIDQTPGKGTKTKRPTEIPDGSGQ